MNTLATPLEPLSVSALTAQIKSLLEATFLEVYLQGEISNFTLHKASGHLYFSLKDASSSIRCVMFKGNAKSLTFTPENGLQVIIKGALSLYAPRGEYQIICHSLTQSGKGSLSAQYEALKKSLKSKGYFAQSRKKPLPPFPKKIALLTSLSGAALQDMKRVASTRWTLTKLVCFDTLTQGEQAGAHIAHNIAYVDSFFGTDNAFDIIVIGRGGGSMEDLWGFNEEIVANAIFYARTPIVSAVGHEIDFVISDFVADLRAATPSACMEIILPDKREWLLRLDEIRAQYDTSAQHSLAKAQKLCDHLLELYQQKSYANTLSFASEQLGQLHTGLNATMAQILQAKGAIYATQALQYEQLPLLREREYALLTLAKELQALDPKRLVRENFAQILRDGKPVQVGELRGDDEIELCDGVNLARARVLSL